MFGFKTDDVSPWYRNDSLQCQGLQSGSTFVIWPLQSHLSPMALRCTKSTLVGWLLGNTEQIDQIYIETIIKHQVPDPYGVRNSPSWDWSSGEFKTFDLCRRWHWFHIASHPCTAHFLIGRCPFTLASITDDSEVMSCSEAVRRQEVKDVMGSIVFGKSGTQTIWATCLPALNQVSRARSRLAQWWLWGKMAARDFNGPWLSLNSCILERMVWSGLSW